MTAALEAGMSYFQCLRTLVAELNSLKNCYSGQYDNACGHDWNKCTGGRYDGYEQGFGRTCMSAKEKTDILAAEATGLRSPPNRPEPLAV